MCIGKRTHLACEPLCRELAARSATGTAGKRCLNEFAAVNDVASGAAVMRLYGHTLRRRRRKSPQIVGDGSPLIGDETRLSAEAARGSGGRRRRGRLLVEGFAESALMCGRSSRGSSQWEAPTATAVVDAIHCGRAGVAELISRSGDDDAITQRLIRTPPTERLPELLTTSAERADRLASEPSFHGCSRSWRSSSSDADPGAELYRCAGGR